VLTPATLPDFRPAVRGFANFHGPSLGGVAGMLPMETVT
jgi:hypothetical protein